jgi:hypothetical protein
LSDEQLRVSFAAAVPELTDVAFRTESTVSSALLGLDGTAQATEAAAPTLPGASGNRLGLSGSDLELMKSIFRCRESDMGLPIGWPWMGPAVDSLEKTSVAAIVGGSPQGGECNVAPQTTAANPELEKRLAAFESLLGPESKTAMGKQYGPDFQTDNPGIILLGWLLTTLAASMGAPFWFQLIRKLIGR